MNYSEIFGDIIKDDIIKLNCNYEFENNQLMFDCAGIHISKKENYLDVINNHKIVITYFYSSKLKKMAKDLKQLYDDKLNNKEISYEEYNMKINKVREEIKRELLNDSKKYGVSVNLKNIIYPNNFVDKVNIALEILENSETERKYKTGKFFIELFKQAFWQIKNYIKNMLHNRENMNF